MKKIIENKMYNTETAKDIAEYSCGDHHDFGYYSETLYLKKTGEFFLYGSGGAASCYSKLSSSGYYTGDDTIIPFSENEAKDWLTSHDFVDEYIDLFGEPEE